MKRIWGKKGWPGNSLYRGEEVAVPKKLLSKLRATEMTDRRAGSSRRRMKMSHRYVAYCPPNLQTDTHLQVLCGVNNSLKCTKKRRAHLNRLARLTRSMKPFARVLAVRC